MSTSDVTDVWRNNVKSNVTMCFTNQGLVKQCCKQDLQDCIIDTLVFTKISRHIIILFTK